MATGVGEADLLPGGERVLGLSSSSSSSSPHRGEGEASLSALHSLSFASVGEVSSRPSSASTSDVSFRSSVDDPINRWRWLQSEIEEIPSFRWMASPLLPWATRGTWERAHLREEIVHFDGHWAFTLKDLLTSSAQVLGRGSLGNTYLATLKDGCPVVVKRMTWAKISRTFEAEVNMLGKIRHPNILALRAYYSSPEGDKLLLFDYIPKGSLAAVLQAGNRRNTRFDWPTRMKIAIAAARGLCHLHSQANTVHGNLTSRNILLDDHTHAKIAGYGLSRLATLDDARSEKKATASTETDVYSLGVVLLELLTGKSPPWKAIRDLSLPNWVVYMANETNAVLDEHLVGDEARKNAIEMLITLKLARHCVNSSPDARPDVQQVLQQLEEINPNVAFGLENETVDDYLQKLLDRR